MNARGFTLIEIIVTIILMAIMGFMAAQLIATTLRGSAESAGQIKDLTEATSTLEECIAYLNPETSCSSTAKYSSRTWPHAVSPRTGPAPPTSASC